MIDLARMRSMRYRAGAHEQKAFEHGMVHDMKKTAGKSKECQHRRSDAEAKKPDSQTHHDNPDILEPFILKKGMISSSTIACFTMRPMVGSSSSATSNITISSNHIHDNGIEGSIYQHNSYTESRGIVFEFNHYGPLRTSCLGNNLKDRSSGTVIRYNWIEAGS